jgi:Ca-activated chloride channel family protein
MRTKLPAFMVCISVIFGLAGGLPAWASPPQPERGSRPDSVAERTLAPFFFVQSDDPAVDQLPLKATEAAVRIVGVLADVTIVQTYRNEGQRTLEALYVFPASTRAAVHSMRMTIGERVIHAQIMKRLEARETYEQARQAGQTASLLEQQRPNVFQMNVANILPGDEIRVDLNYVEVLEPRDGIYEFVYPAVVGPRYSNIPETGAPDTMKWIQNPYLHSGKPAPYRFGLNLDLHTAIPISQLTSPSHSMEVEYSGKTHARLRIADDPKAGTKDFVLRYSLAGGQIQSGILLYKGGEENFFLLMMEPPARVTSDALLPREYIFIVDVSGSMNGFPLRVSKELLSDVISQLGPRDFINVLLFSGGSAVLSDAGSLQATEENKRKAISWIQSQRGGGGTELLPALERAFRLPKTQGVSRIVVVATDGYVAVEPETFELIRQRLGEANLFAFGIGSSVNRHLIEGMARAGRGEPFVILDEQEARRQAARFRDYIRGPILTDIRVSFRGIRVHDVEPSTLPDLFALRPLVLLGKYEGRPSGDVVIRGKTAQGDFEKVISLSEDAAFPKDRTLSLLWARHRIMRLSDMERLRPDEARAEEITALGLKYSLMTPFTSFVAVDTVRRADGSLLTVRQPLPLPEGVSDLAVGEPRIAAKAPPGATQSLSMQMDKGQWQDEGEVREKKEPRGPEGPKVRVEAVRGALDRLSLERSLRRALEEGACRPPEGIPGWEAIVRIHLRGGGRMETVDIVNSTVQDPSLLECVKRVIEGIGLGHAVSGEAEAIVKITW